MVWGRLEETGHKSEARRDITRQVHKLYFHVVVDRTGDSNRDTMFTGPRNAKGRPGEFHREERTAICLGGYL